MRGQSQHGILPDETHDEISYQEFVTSLKVHVLTDLSTSNRRIYENKILPELSKEKKPTNITNTKISQAMRKNVNWQTWSSLNRLGQEMMFDTLGGRVERQLTKLNAQAVAGKKVKGSLKTDASLTVPRYNSAIDIHCQPGGYHNELTPDDTYAGALYDIGAYQYGMGGQGPMSDDVGITVGRYLKKQYPDFQPRRILDLGCGVGHQTLGLLSEFPKSEIYGCDLGAPMLRYGQMRAASLGREVHFSQDNAERTKYKTESFDLVTSLSLLHETSSKAVPQIIKECYRLLKPGGIMVHGDVPEFNKYWPNPYDQFQRDWTTHYNAEPFRSRLREIDVPELARDAGFLKKHIHEDLVPSAFGETGYFRTSLYGKTHSYGMKWWVLVAQKS